MLRPSGAPVILLDAKPGARVGAFANAPAPSAHPRLISVAPPGLSTAHCLLPSAYCLLLHLHVDERVPAVVGDALRLKRRVFEKLVLLLQMHDDECLTA